MHDDRHRALRSDRPAPIAAFCSASNAAVDFVLPSTGDIAVDVVVP